MSTTTNITEKLVLTKLDEVVALGVLTNPEIDKVYQYVANSRYEEAISFLAICCLAAIEEANEEEV